MKRLFLWGLVACAPFMVLGGLIDGFWPFNILFTLLLSTSLMYLIDKRQGENKFLTFLIGVPIFIIGGSSVEFWYPAVTMALGAWYYCKSPSKSSLLVWFLSTAALYAINSNFWALMIFPLVFFAQYVDLAVPRIKHFFYVYYPVHLSIIFLIVHFR